MKGLRLNVLAMLGMRKYHVADLVAAVELLDDDDDEDEDVADYRELTMQVIHTKRRNDRVRVRFVPPPPPSNVSSSDSIGLPLFRSLITEIGDAELTRIIFIIPQGYKITSYILKHIEELEHAKKTHWIECLWPYEMLPPLGYPGTRYKVLDEHAAKEVVAKGKYQFLERSDRLARYFGLDRGDVLKCTKRSESAGLYTTYKKVVMSPAREAGIVP